MPQAVGWRLPCLVAWAKMASDASAAMATATRNVIVSAESTRGTIWEEPGSERSAESCYARSSIRISPVATIVRYRAKAWCADCTRYWSPASRMRR